MKWKMIGFSTVGVMLVWLMADTQVRALMVLLGFAVVVCWCMSGNSGTTGTSGAAVGMSGASCRFCSYSGSTAQRVADHEAGHWVAGKALGCTPTSAEIWGDGSGVTYIEGITTDRQQAIISAARGASPRAGGTI